MITLSVVTANIAKRRIQQQAYRTLLAIGRETVGSGVQGDLEESVADLKLLGVEILSHDPASWASVLAPYAADEANASWVAIFDGAGTLQASAGDAGLIPAPPARQWLVGARLSPTVGWDVASQCAILATALNSANFQGVLVVALGRDWTQRLTETRKGLLRAHDAAQLAILTKEGEIVSGPRWIAALGAGKFREWVGVDSDSVGKMYLTAAIPITGSLAAPLGWRAILVEPTDVAFSAARDVQMAILKWGLLLSVASAALKWYVARRSVRPLIQLAGIATERRGSSAFFAHIGFSGRKDEVGFLANAWNKLLERIEEHSKQMSDANRDLTQALMARADSERRLQLSERQYRQVFQTVTEGLIIYDRKGVVVTANVAAATFHGRKPSEMVGCLRTGLTPASEQTAVERAFRDAAAGHPTYLESVVEQSDGARLHVGILATAFESGAEQHILAIFRDINEERRLARQVEQAARMDSLGRLSANIAHEINNVLMGIGPFAEIIRRRHHDDPALKSAATHIARSVDRGKRITEEILRFTRNTEPVLRTFACGRWLSKLSDELAVLLGAAVGLVVDCASKDVMLFGDQSQLDQVLSNLCLNARDAMDGEGTVTVHVENAGRRARQVFVGLQATDGFVHLSVADTGHGIPPEVQKHLFEPLFTTKGSHGTGLGLAIVQQVVLLHGGQIQVESSAGHGATFHILLPQSTAEEDVAVLVQPLSELTAKRVLLVEDEESVAAGLCALLQIEGVSTHHVALGSEVFEAVDSFRPDLIVLDIGLPDISGVEVYRRLNDSGRHIPTVFSTGHGEADEIWKDPLDGKSVLLRKPYGFERLRQAMSEVMDVASVLPDE